MNYNADFKEWLNKVRFSRNVCMLIPMEACMGYPIVVEHGVEYIIPFFKVASIENTDKLTPPFAYLRINYPSTTILTYNNLRTLPEWKSIDWSLTAEKNDSYIIASKIENYYKALCCCENSSRIAEQQDELLLDCLYSQSVDSSNSPPLVVWYKKLIDESKKYRKGEDTDEKS